MALNSAKSVTVHASCVALGTSGVLIFGPSGSGKSSLSLELVSRGAALIADDRTIVTKAEQGLVATCPKPLCGKIEIRGVGILAIEAQTSAQVRLVVDLGKVEDERLPVSRHRSILDHEIPLLHAPDIPHFPAAILQYLKGGRIA